MGVGVSHDGPSRERMAAIYRALTLGRELQQSHPDIATRWVAGESYADIAKRLKSVHAIQVSIGILKSAVAYAIHGHNGGYNIEPYSGTLQPGVSRDEVVRQHHSDGGKRGGSKGGMRLREEGRGIFEQSHEERIASGQHSARSRGWVVWKEAGQYRGQQLPNERQFVYEQSLKPEFRRGSRCDLVALTKLVNDTFHEGKPVRNPGSVRTAIVIYKREIGVLKPDPSKPAKQSWAERVTGEEKCVLSEAEFGGMCARAAFFADAARNCPDWPKIAEQLNRNYHNGQPVRSAQAVRVRVGRELRGDVTNDVT